MGMKKKMLSATLCAVMVGSLVAPAFTVQAADDTLVYWSMWEATEPQGQVIQEAVDAYTEQTGVKVDLQFKGRTGNREALQPALDGGTQIDIFDEDIDRVNGMYGKYLLDLEDLAKENDYEATANAGLMAACRDAGGGTLKTIPYQPNVFAFFYNKDLFEQAGIEEVPTTFDQWTEAAEKISALSTAENPIYGSGLFYCYNGQNQSVIQRFGTDYMITGNEEDGFEANLLDNQAFADAMIWMKNLYDNGYNPQETDIDSMMAAGQIGLMTNGGWLKGTLDASGINYGIASLPTVTGEDQKEYALGDMSSFMITTSATDETAKAAEEFINWWMTGTGLEACETTQDVDYSNVTPNAEWSISMCYLNAYLPTVNSKEYQAVDVLVDLTPSETAQVQMFTAPGTLFYSDAASCQGDYVQDWVFNGPTDPTYDDVQDFFADYQADLEDYIADYYD